MKIITKESNAVNWSPEAMSQSKTNVVLQLLNKQNHDEHSVNGREDTRCVQDFPCLGLGPL